MILKNLLNQALTVIPSQSGTLFKFDSRTKNRVGQYVTTFAAGVPVNGSFQAVPREILQHMGLDTKKIYYILFTSDDVSGLFRDGRGDQIEYEGFRLQAEKEGGWKPVDGWSGIMLVEVPNDG